MKSKQRPRLPANFHYIRQADAKLALKCGDPRMDQYTLADYYLWSLESDNLVILRAKRGAPLAVMHLVIHRSHLSLEMLAINQNNQNQGLGTQMLTLVEQVIAPFFGKNEVRLEALSEVVSWYSNQRYSKTGPSLVDPIFGTLTPMRKLLP